MLLKKKVSQTTLLFLILVLTIYPISLFLAQFLELAPISNILGFFALACYIATLLPSILKIVFPITKKNRKVVWLFKYRRHLGLAAFSFGLNHGILQILKRQLNLLEWQTYIHYFPGFLMLLIFTLLATTSNDLTVKKLKQSWKKIHKLTYLVIFLLPWHIIDKMSGNWTFLTPIAVLISTIIACLFAARKYLDVAARS
jgi:methionine sulfoxide reductase heme-binding subunit